MRFSFSETMFSILLLAIVACSAGAVLSRGTTYGAALDACIIAATNRAEADTCRQKVDCQYNEPTCVTVKDAGNANDANK